MAPGATITGSSYPPYSGAFSEEPEPEVIRQWRERRDLELQEREEKSELKKAETIRAAQQSIDDFYENYNTKKEKMIAQTRREAEEFLASREDTSAGGTSWERIAKLVDLSGKGVKGGASGTGKERFRELLMSLRKDEKAPGASGY
jgi:Clathrin light chain